MNRSKVFAVALVLAGGALSQSSVWANDIHCPPHLGAVSIDGNVHVYAGGSLTATNVRIIGNIQAERADFIDVSGGSIGGSVQLDDLVGDRSVIENASIGGSVQLKSNRSRIEVAGNEVGADIQAFSNRGGLLIFGNVVDGNLQCKENAPAPAGGNNRVDGNKENQCANLRPEASAASAPAASTAIAATSSAAAANAGGSPPSVRTDGGGGGGAMGWFVALLALPLFGRLAVLTQTARYWFEATRDICPNHVIEYPDPNVVVAQRLDILPVEIVVRGYLAGTTGTSLLTLYESGQRDIYGFRFPDGMRANEKLAQPIITPTTKQFDGGHDAPLTASEILERNLLTPAQWSTVSRYALALFARGQELAAQRGLILADTKYEFGLDSDGRIVLADEIHTPDSSRWWFAASYPAHFAAGERPASFDKDFVRSWVLARCDPYRDPIPPIPEDVVIATARVYIDAYERITGQTFAPPSGAEPPLQRIRRNLARFSGPARL